MPPPSHTAHTRFVLLSIVPSSTPRRKPHDRTRRHVAWLERGWGVRKSVPRDLDRSRRGGARSRPRTRAGGRLGLTGLCTDQKACSAWAEGAGTDERSSRTQRRSWIISSDTRPSCHWKRTCPMIIPAAATRSLAAAATAGGCCLHALSPGRRAPFADGAGASYTLGWDAGDICAHSFAGLRTARLRTVREVGAASHDRHHDEPQERKGRDSSERRAAPTRMHGSVMGHLPPRTTAASPVLACHLALARGVRGSADSACTRDVGSACRRWSLLLGTT
jgi:hypothetical protein